MPTPPPPLVGDLRDRIAAAITEDALKPRAERVGLVNAMLAVVQPLLAARDTEILQLRQQLNTLARVRVWSDGDRGFLYADDVRRAVGCPMSSTAQEG